MFDDFEPEEDDDEGAEASAITGTLPPPRENPDCLGHASVEAMLSQLIAQNRLPHALIFAGRQGIGKATMAYRLARFLLSSATPDIPSLMLEEEGVRGGGPSLFGSEEIPPSPTLPPAGGREGEEKRGGLYVSPDSPIFRQVASGGHPDLMTIERAYDEKKDRRKEAVDIDGIRRVGPFLRMTASTDGGWRVAIVDDADTMTRQAQNAILKILEEPPKRAVLILVAHRPGILIPTIRSRCRMVPFAPLSPETYGALAGRISANADKPALYSLTEGSIGQTAALLEGEGLELLGKLIVLAAALPKLDWVEIHALSEKLGRAGQEDSYRSFETLLRWMVDSLVRQSARTAPLPAILAPLALLSNRRSLAQWIDIQQNLTAHLNRIRHANLDKRQGVLGAFIILATDSPI
jgi:DNA polymerase-3 subunit delta'